MGLHLSDIEKLIKALRRLVEIGNTVAVVEHQLDIWATSDWMIDLGPTGGEDGGELMGQATPGQIGRKILLLV